MGVDYGLFAQTHVLIGMPNIKKLRGLLLCPLGMLAGCNTVLLNASGDIAVAAGATDRRHPRC